MKNRESFLKLTKAVLLGAMSVSIGVSGLSPLAVGVVQAETITYTNPYEQVVTEDIETFGQCGKNAYWSYDNNSKTLTISGKGSTYNYEWDEMGGSSQPWNQLRQSIKKVIIKKGIKGIGNYNFFNMEYVTSLSIPKTVTKIGDGCFSELGSLKKITIPDSVKTIGDESFFRCDLVKTVNIGKGLTKVGARSFSWLKVKSKITIKSTKLKSVKEGAFYSPCDKSKKNIKAFYVPKSKLKAYKKLIDKAGNKAFNTYIKGSRNKQSAKEYYKWVASYKGI